jgi:hypothetical protein
MGSGSIAVDRSPILVVFEGSVSSMSPSESERSWGQSGVGQSGVGH